MFKHLYSTPLDLLYMATGPPPHMARFYKSRVPLAGPPNSTRLQKRPRTSKTVLEEPHNALVVL
jgi:hypothetical protein